MRSGRSRGSNVSPEAASSSAVHQRCATMSIRSSGIQPASLGEVAGAQREPCPVAQFVWVPGGVDVEVDDVERIPHRLGVQPGLLKELSHCRASEVLTRIHAAARRDPPWCDGVVLAVGEEEQHSVIRVGEDQPRRGPLASHGAYSPGTGMNAEVSPTKRV